MARTSSDAAQTAYHRITRWLGIPIAFVSGLAFASPQYSDSKECPGGSTIVTSPPRFALHAPLLPEEVVYSPLRFAAARLIRTDDTQVTPDQGEAQIEITSAHFPRLLVSAKYFRSLEVRWVTDRILFIWRDIGHTTSAEELIDVIDRKWLSRKCVGYDDQDD